MAQNARNKGIEIKPSSLREKILDLINEQWPIHPSGICKILNVPSSVKNISKLSYHFRILHKNNKINLKKIDRALIAWPKDIEKLRVMHEFMKE